MQADRYMDIRSGMVMVVSDLHGDGDAFDRYLQTFLTLRDMGEVDRIIFLGDVLHGYGSIDQDASLRMLLRIIELQESLGKDYVIMLLGNHEMPHIYGVSLAKGELEFTPRFEHMLGDHRERVQTFLKTLPFVVRTNAGVLLCHAGPDDSSIHHISRLRHFDHDELLNDASKMLAQQADLDRVYETYAELSGKSYAELAHEYLAVSSADDPRYSHLMRALLISERDHRFAMLWDFLFTQNERGLVDAAYEQICRRYLDALSASTVAAQRVCLSGHIVVPDGGYKVVNDRHFRLASATHARPRESGVYVLFDAAKPIKQAADLKACVASVF